MVLVFLICAMYHYYEAIDGLFIPQLLCESASDSGSHVLGGDGLPEFGDATVLITGVAGFIGYSVASHILQRNLGKVVGIDNFNTYYDIGLKYRRADILSHYHNMLLTSGDINNSSLIRSVLKQHNVTHVVHLAAQAGVRYSLENPLAYIRDNVMGFLTLLTCRHLTGAGWSKKINREGVI